MFRFSSVLFKKAAPAALTFAEADREELSKTILGLFDADMAEKGVTIPAYVKVPFAMNAKTTDDKVAGSCCGYTVWDELHVNMFCANPDVQVAGTGKVLMHAMEALARERGCLRVDLDTYSWQARPFYEKCGFSVFGTQKDYPKGHEKYFMEKRWEKGSSMDASVYALKGKSEAAKALKVVDGDEKEIDVRLDRWLDDNTQSRKIPGVKPYVKKEYAVAARLTSGEFAAGCVFETLWDELHISFFATEAKLKGMGIGSTFIEHMASVALEKGCNRMSLETMSWQAQPFYEKHGFTVFGKQEGIPTHEFSRVYLQRIL